MSNQPSGPQVRRNIRFVIPTTPRLTAAEGPKLTRPVDVHEADLADLLHKLGATSAADYNTGQDGSAPGVISSYRDHGQIQDGMAYCLLNPNPKKVAAYVRSHLPKEG